ncbi:MAG: LPXTG cell wall anchor domain-containing protein [Actinomycetota bacterium]|nr:LPXTG cell wall anchor domain-containing protein [Actinomycetota bacterium]
MLSEIQTLFVEDPPAFTLYYPDTNYAYSASAYDRWMPVEGHGIHHKWSFIPAASELLGIERVSQTTSTEDTGSSNASLYALVGIGAIVLLALVVFFWRRSARKTDEDQI